MCPRFGQGGTNLVVALCRGSYEIPGGKSADNRARRRYYGRKDAAAEVRAAGRAAQPLDLTFSHSILNLRRERSRQQLEQVNAYVGDCCKTALLTCVCSVVQLRNGVRNLHKVSEFAWENICCERHSLICAAPGRCTTVIFLDHISSRGTSWMIVSGAYLLLRHAVRCCGLRRVHRSFCESWRFPSGGRGSKNDGIL